MTLVYYMSLSTKIDFLKKSFRKGARISIWKRKMTKGMNIKFYYIGAVSVRTNVGHRPV